MPVTSTPLPMYDFPELADARDTFLRRFAETARRAGLDRDVSFTQICGYPLVTTLRHRYDVVGAPVYDVPFSRGATHCGLIVARADGPYAGLEDLRGTRFALNSFDSNTGMNLPRALVAPLARAGRFFDETVETGSHLASLTAVRNGAADCASIDNVTFALLAECRPAAVDGVRVVAATAPSPTLPFVTVAGSNARTRALLYDALAATVEALRRSSAIGPLHLAGVEPATLATYEPLLQLERDAAAFGYGTLA